MYSHVGGKRTFVKTVTDVSIPANEWVRFRIKQKGRDITITLGEKSHAFSLPEDWPKGRQVGLITA